MKKLDYLPNTNVYLYQDDDMFRINSDTRYLGEFLRVKKNEVILDIGTNNGALLLYANIIGCKKLIGVDINSKAIELCEENMTLNGITNYELYNCKVQDLEIDKCDVIVCNPPYFKNSLKNNNINLLHARHDELLSLSDLVSSCKRLLKDNGRVYLIYRSSDLVSVIKELDSVGLGIVNLQFIIDENKEFSHCFLLEAIKNRKSNVKVSKPIIIAR